MESHDFVDEILTEDLQFAGSIKLVSELTDIQVCRSLIRECGGFNIYIPQKQKFKEAIKRWLIKHNKIYVDPNYVVRVTGMSKDSASKLLKELRSEYFAKSNAIRLFEEIEKDQKNEAEKLILF